MNYRKPFFVLLAGVLLLSAAPGRSQTFEAPSVQGSSSFAVITDTRTARECRSQMTAYKQTLESEGLPVYIVSYDWTTPEEVRNVLRKLYVENALEGCVFIGDVPIAMISKAQHLTSAFKMDERDHPLHETSVPSDRFYDDFDLLFVPQGTPLAGVIPYITRCRPIRRSISPATSIRGASRHRKPTAIPTTDRPLSGKGRGRTP